MQDTYTLSGTQPIVAAAVRVEMARANVNQRELAELCGWTQQYVSRRLVDKEPTPFSVDDLVSIARALRCPLAALLPDELVAAPAAA